MRWGNESLVLSHHRNKDPVPFSNPLEALLCGFQKEPRLETTAKALFAWVETVFEISDSYLFWVLSLKVRQGDKNNVQKPLYDVFLPLEF